MANEKDATVTVTLKVQFDGSDTAAWDKFGRSLVGMIGQDKAHEIVHALSAELKKNAKAKTFTFTDTPERKRKRTAGSAPAETGAAAGE